MYSSMRFSSAVAWSPLTNARLSLALLAARVHLLAKEANDGCTKGNQQAAKPQQQLVLVVLIIVNVVGTLHRLLHSVVNVCHLSELLDASDKCVGVCAQYKMNR